MAVTGCHKQVNMAESWDESENRLKEHLLECSVIAALGGHDLGEWEQADERGLQWQAICRRCSKSIYASNQVIYSILADTCPHDT